MVLFLQPADPLRERSGPVRQGGFQNQIYAETQRELLAIFWVLLDGIPGPVRFWAQRFCYFLNTDRTSLGPGLWTEPSARPDPGLEHLFSYLYQPVQFTEPTDMFGGSRFWVRTGCGPFDAVFIVSK